MNAIKLCARMLWEILLCSHIGKPRWAAVDAGSHVINAPGASGAAYAGEPAKNPTYSTTLTERNDLLSYLQLLPTSALLNGC